VKYFSQGKDRIFARSKTVIGRRVENCYPPASVHIVQKVIENLRSGKKDHEDFWISMGDKYVMPSYLPENIRGNKEAFCFNPPLPFHKAVPSHSAIPRINPSYLPALLLYFPQALSAFAPPLAFRSSAPTSLYQ